MEQNTNELKCAIKEFEQKMEQNTNELKRAIKEFEQRMLIRLGALMIAAIGIMVALSNLNVV